MNLTSFLVSQGIKYVDAKQAISQGRVSVLLAGKDERIKIWSDIDFGYGDKVWIRHEGTQLYFCYKAGQRRNLVNRKKGRISWKQLAAAGAIVYLLYKFFASVYPGPQWKAEALKRAEEDERIAKMEKRKLENRIKLQEIQDRKKQAERAKEQAKKDKEQREREAMREAEKQRRLNVPMGTSASVRDDRVIAVTDARLYDYLSANNQFAPSISAEGGKLLVVYMTIKNTGKESGDMAWSIFKVEDEAGNTYRELRGESFALSMWADERGLGDSDDQLFPDQSKRIAKVFRVKTRAAGLKLAVNNHKFLLYR